MDTTLTLIKNNAASPRIVSWTDRTPHVPGPLSPGWDPIRGHYGEHTVLRKLVIHPGAVQPVPSDVLARLRETDAVIAAWFQVGDLVVTEST